jgi:hypothetical protein
MQITYILWEPAGGEGGVIYMSIVMDIKTNTICHVCIYDMHGCVWGSIAETTRNKKMNYH